MWSLLYWLFCINLVGSLIGAAQDLTDTQEPQLLVANKQEETVVQATEAPEEKTEDVAVGQATEVQESVQEEQAEPTEFLAAEQSAPPAVSVEAGSEDWEHFDVAQHRPVEVVQTNQFDVQPEGADQVAQEKLEAKTEEPVELVQEVPTEQEVPAAVVVEEAQPEVVIEEQFEDIQDIDLAALPKEAEEEKVVSIDTMDLGEPQGNWLFKRHWWKRANKIYDHISELVNEAFEQRAQFMTKRSELEHELFDPFYLNVGIKQGELKGLISFLIDHLKQDADNEDLSEKERLLIDKLKGHKAIIEQLNRDIQDIGQIDRTVDQAINTLMDQLSLARAYKQQAWDYFKDIERELSDQRARELVFEMRALEKNIKDIIAYLSGSFTAFFDTLTKTAQEEVARIQFAIADLKDKGVNLKEEAEILEFHEQVGPEKDLEPQQEGFFSRIWSGITSFFSGIWSTITGWFG